MSPTIYDIETTRKLKTSLQELNRSSTKGLSIRTEKDKMDTNIKMNGPVKLNKSLNGIQSKKTDKDKKTININT